MTLGDATTNALAQAAVSAIVPDLTIRTSFTPPAQIYLAGSSGSGNGTGSGGFLMNILRPAVDFDTIQGPITIAPYGDPGMTDVTTWAMLAGAGLAAFAGLFIWIGVRIAEK